MFRQRHDTHNYVNACSHCAQKGETYPLIALLALVLPSPAAAVLIQDGDQIFLGKFYSLSWTALNLDI